MKVQIINLVVLFTYFLFENKYCFADPNEKRLLHHLIDTYNTHERPVMFQNDTILVSLSLKLQRLVYLYPQHQQIGILGVLRYEWSDINLKWNTSEFGQVSKVHLPSSRVWKPDISLFKESNGIPDPTCLTTSISIDSNGFSSFETMGKFEVHCRLSLYDFPFDEHECQFEFGSWSYQPNEIYVTIPDGTTEGDLSEYVGNPDFHLIGVSVKEKQEHGSRIIYTIKLKRKGDSIIFWHKLMTTITASMIILSTLLSPKVIHKLSLNLSAIGLCIYTVVDIISSTCTFAVDNQIIRITGFYLNFLFLATFALFTNSIIIYIYFSTRMMSNPLQKLVTFMESFSCLTELEPSPIKVENETMEKTDNEIMKNKRNWRQLSLMLDKLLFGIWSFVIIVFCCFAFPKF